jgi:hypothetical protein
MQVLCCLLSVLLLLLASVCEAADPRDVVRAVHGIGASRVERAVADCSTAQVNNRIVAGF